MKTILLILTALLVSFGSLSAADPFGSRPAEEPKGEIDFKKVDAQQALQFYAGVTGLDLITDSRALQIRSPIELQASKLSDNEMKRLIEKALREQAGIIITPLGDKKASVTYNDALPITQK